jgi:hypothetical protein
MDQSKLHFECEDEDKSYIRDGAQGSIFWSENDIYSPPPFRKCYFSLSLFDSYCALFVFILPYFAFISPLTPIFSFSFHFVPFPFTFSTFSSSPFYIFPSNDIG